MSAWKRSTKWLIFCCALFFSTSVFALALNDAIKATANLSVRATASTSGTLVTTKPLGSVGTITQGPTLANGYTWWKVTWDTGFQGWSVANSMVLNTPIAKSFSFASGIQVTTGTTNTRATASTTGTLLAAKPVGSTGYIASGPVFANGYAWWQVSWTGGPIGWSVQDYLIPYTFPPTITGVTTTCSPSTIQVNQTAQCSATVTGTGAYSSQVSWGSSTLPAISQTGLFTAPSVVPPSGYATIAAVSTQDTSKVGYANITITAPPSSITSVSVSCTPSTISVNQTAQCQAALAGTGPYNPAVNWSITSGSGSVNSAGFYSAPGSATSATIRTTSVQDGAKNGSAVVSVTATPSVQPASSVVFSDTTGNGWYPETWSGATVDLASPNAHDGEYGVTMTTTEQWGRVMFTTWAGYHFDTTGYQTLSFWLNIGAYEGETIYVGLLNDQYVVDHYLDIAYPEHIADGTLNAYQWKYVTLKIEDLWAVDQSIYGVEIQLADPGTISIDDVQFNHTGVCQ